MLRIILAFGMLAAGSTWSQAGIDTCYVPYIKVVDGVTKPGYMFVKAGYSCTMSLKDSGGAVQKIEVTKRPSHGTLEQRPFGFRYTPRKGFVGKDSFGFRDYSQGVSRTIVRSVDMDITVQP